MANKYEVHDIVDALNHKRQELVFIEDGEIVIPERNYRIELSRIEDRAALIDWIHHLCSKQWTTAEIIRQFISLVYGFYGWELYQSAE